MTASTATESAADRTALQQALRFSDDDLSANRQGRLSEMQHYRLRVRRRRSIGVGVLAILVAAFIATLLIFAGGRSDNAILVMVGIGVTLCSAALTGVFARYWLRLSAAIRSGEVAVTSGEVERVVRPVTRRVVNTLIRVGDVEMFVARETFDTFTHHGRYTLYRVPTTGELLAAEPETPR